MVPENQSERFKVFQRSLPWETEEHTFRLDPTDIVELEGAKNKKYKVPRRVEIKTEKGRWKKYRAVVFYAGLPREPEHEHIYIAALTIGAGNQLGVCTSRADDLDVQLIRSANTAGLKIRCYQF